MRIGGKVMIDGKTPIEEVLARYPEAASVFDEFGLGCAGCKAALFENIEQGARIHGVKVEDLVEGLNKIARED
jgi:hybrid cluster-associated redox disulfide protein